MFYTAIALQIITFIYHQLTTRFDYFPFNGIRNYTMKERRNEALNNGIIMIVPILLTLTNQSILVGIGAMVWSLVIVGAVINWWLPYLTGIVLYKFPNSETWNQIYERIFAKTITILPNIKNRPIPNIEHMILHVFMIASAISTWMYTFHVS